MLDYGFSEGTDFVAIAQKKVTAQGNQSEFIEHVFKTLYHIVDYMLTRNNINVLHKNIEKNVFYS